MTLPHNLTQDEPTWASERSKSATTRSRNKVSNAVSRTIPSSWKVTDEDVRKAGVQVCRNVSLDERTEILNMLGIKQHLVDGEKINAAGNLATYDKKSGTRRKP